MLKQLETLGFSSKEAKIYLALIELGAQAASTIARKTGYPKSTVLFTLGELSGKGYVEKTYRERTQYFFADPIQLQRRAHERITKESKALQEVIPLLEEIRSPFTSLPKVTFHEGLENCKQAYLSLLESTTDIWEFGAHKDMVNKFGSTFMERFIGQRKKRNIFLHAISKDDASGQEVQKVSSDVQREVRLFPNHLGTLYSSIAIFEHKVLLLNLYKDPFCIIVENFEMAESLKTIFRVCYVGMEGSINNREL